MVDFMKKPVHPLAILPDLDLQTEHIGALPNDEECFALWDYYQMLDNIRTHSLLVADFATALAELACAKGFNVCVRSIRSSALLHDIAKTYTIDHGGSHAQIGASWVISATGNRNIAQGVAMHVHWPWDIPYDVCRLPFFVIYADKRIMHEKCVPLATRYDDLLIRYGITEQHKASIHESYMQGKNIESAFSAQLGVSLDAYTIDSGRLVQRT